MHRGASKIFSSPTPLRISNGIALSYNFFATLPKPTTLDHQWYRYVPNQLLCKNNSLLDCDIVLFYPNWTVALSPFCKEIRLWNFKVFSQLYCDIDVQWWKVRLRVVTDLVCWVATRWLKGWNQIIWSGNLLFVNFIFIISFLSTIWLSSGLILAPETPSVSNKRNFHSRHAWILCIWMKVWQNSRWLSRRVFLLSNDIYNCKTCNTAAQKLNAVQRFLQGSDFWSFVSHILHCYT